MSIDESRLDDSHRNAAIDSRKFGELIRGFAGQVADAARLADHVRLPGGLPRAMCLLGMGGSAVAGDLLRALADPVAPFPIHVVRGYAVPAWVGPDTLVVASSYSGNTEETLAAFDAARRRTARLLVLSSGGELGALAQQEGLPWVRLPAGFPPRAALAFLLLPLVVQLERLGAGIGGVAEREEAVAVLTALGAVLAPEVPTAENAAKGLALRLAGRVPAIYGSELTAPVAYRWRTQLEENAEVLALSGELPEMNHNAIEAWGAGPEAAWAIVLLRDPGEHPRVVRRFALTREIVGAHVPIHEVQARGEGRLARLLSLVLQGDWTSYYVSLRRSVDPWAVDRLEAFKRRMAAPEG
jgi:glucose/mannose-6-phosphate isomerase